MSERISDQSKGVVLYKIKDLYRSLSIMASLENPPASYNPLYDRAIELGQLSSIMGIPDQLVRWAQESGMDSGEELANSISPIDKNYITILGDLDKEALTNFIKHLED